MRFLKLTTPKDIVISELEKAGLGMFPASKVAEKLGINKARLNYICGHHNISLANVIDHWTKDEIGILRDLRSEGKSFSSIGEIVGRSATSCRMKYRRFVLKERI